MKRAFSHSHKGFSLIEVLIASAILFAALSVATLAYSQSVRSAEKIAALHKVSARMETIRLMIREEIRVNPGVGEGTGQIGSLHYQWQIKDVQESNSRAWQQLPDLETERTHYKLFLLNLAVKIDVKHSTGRSVLSRSAEMELLEWQRI